MTASRDYFSDAFRQLESPIGHARDQSRVLQILAEVLTNDIASPFGMDGSIVPDAVVFMSTEVANSISALSAQHLALHNASPEFGRLRSPAAAVDPLLDLVRRYREQRDQYNALPGSDDNGVNDALYNSMVEPLYSRLKSETPAATTEAGALAALRLAVEEMQHSHGSFEKPLLAAAMAYFDGRQA